MKFFRILGICIIILALCVSVCFADDTDFENSERGTDIVKQEVSTEVLRISANDTNGFHSVILGLLGSYNPIVKDYTYQSTQGYTSHSIEIQPDYSWLASALIFLVVIYCMFRIIGTALGGIK